VFCRVHLVGEGRCSREMTRRLARPMGGKWGTPYSQVRVWVGRCDVREGQSERNPQGRALARPVAIGEEREGLPLGLAWQRQTKADRWARSKKINLDFLYPFSRHT
jgi:hypothetical protein